MDQLAKKTFRTRRGLTYTYYFHSAAEDRPALLLQHGFPDDHTLWSNIIPDLLTLQFPLVVPDLLGYNGTDKPTDPQAYNSYGMANDLAEILDHENIGHFISVGHDWGSFMAQRMVIWHPNRAVGAIFLNVAYSPPAEFKLERTQKSLIERTGLPRIAYQEFFVSSGAAHLLESRLEAAFCAIHGGDEGTANFMEDVCCHRGAMENFLKADKRQPVKAYARDSKFHDEWIARFARDGFTAPLNWYHATHSNIHWSYEKSIPQEHLRLNMPVLFIGASRDPVCLTSAVYRAKQAGLLPDLSIKEVDSGHWQTYEVPARTGSIIATWLKERAADLTTRAKSTTSSL